MFNTKSIRTYSRTQRVVNVSNIFTDMGNTDLNQAPLGAHAL